MFSFQFSPVWLIRQDLFNPDRGIDRVEACDVAIEQDRTFGPFVSAENFYSPAPEKSYGQALKDRVLSATLHTLNSNLAISTNLLWVDC